MKHPLLQQADAKPDGVALSVGKRRWSRRAFTDRCSALAVFLRDVYGIAPDDIIATVLGNPVGHAFLINGAGLLGAAVAPLSPRLTPEELSSALSATSPRLLIADSVGVFDSVKIPRAEFKTALLSDLPVPSGSDGMSDSGKGGGAAVRGTGEAFPDFDTARTASVILTSGSSGEPKATPLTWANYLASARASAANLGVRDDDNWLCPIPLHHIGGISVLIRGAIYGMTVTLPDSASAAGLLNAMREEAISIVSMVPTMLWRLLRMPEKFDGASFPSLRAVLLGGAPAPAALLDEALRRRIPVLPTYGLTEACSQVATASPGETPEPGCAGRPLRGFRVEIRDDRSAPVQNGVSGEIWISGDALTSGYLGLNSADCFEGGFFRTGDLGFLDSEGRLHIESRREDLIVTGGEKAKPFEIENILLSHPNVISACVVGIPDEEWGQSVAAAVVPRGSGVDVGELEAYCRTKLSSFKRPKRWMVLDELPVSANGKVSRTAVRALFTDRV